MPADLTGRLLVASPTLPDPNFTRTVVLVLDHDDSGALGVVLNRPTELDLAGPLPAWRALAAEPAVVFAGGPVSPETAIGLARGCGPAGPGFAPVLGPIGTVDLAVEPLALGADVDQVRVYAGYAGWGPGQLDGEVEQGSWVVVEARPDDVLSSRPEELWEAVLRRQGGTVAWLASCPPDPSLN